MLSDPNMVISFSSATNRESKKGDLTQNAQSHWLMPISDNVIRSESSRDALWHFRGSSECRKKCVENGRKSPQKRRKQLLLARRPRDYTLRQQMMKCLHIVRRYVNYRSENRSFRTAEVIRPCLSLKAVYRKSYSLHVLCVTYILTTLYWSRYNTLYYKTITLHNS